MVGIRVRNNRLVLPKTRIVISGTTDFIVNLHKPILDRELDKYRAKYPRALWITGACVGVDEWAAIHLHLNGEVVYTVVPADREKVAKHWRRYCSLYETINPDPAFSGMTRSERYMFRNQRMVQMASMPDPFAEWNANSVIGLTATCLAFPDESETQRSGTWATVRRAKKAGLKIATVIL